MGMLEDAACSLPFNSLCFIFKTWTKVCDKRHLEILEQLSHGGTIGLIN